MPPKGKGLSLEEKRKRALEFFHDTKGVYLMKELEKLLSKQKGITSMTVKDVVTSLVNDDLVIMEKIGTSNYFWSFPSHAKVQRNKKLKELQEEHEKWTSRVAEDEGLIQTLESERIDENRTDLIENYTQLTLEIATMDQKLLEYKDFNPELLGYKKEAVLVAKEATNRWTDNVFIIQSYMQNNFNIPSTEFNKMFEIDASKFDTVE